MFTFNLKKKYFKYKMTGVQKMIWDNEFKREKTLMLREEIRQAYDNVCSKLHVFKEKIATFPADKKNWSDESKGIDDQRVLMEKERDSLISQMQGLDVSVRGSKPTNEYPEGVEGIDQVLEGLHELQIMLQEFYKKI